MGSPYGVLSKVLGCLFFVWEGQGFGLLLFRERRRGSDAKLPCDGVLVSGSLIVNESMLTGP